MVFCDSFSKANSQELQCNLAIRVVSILRMIDAIREAI